MGEKIIAIMCSPAPLIIPTEIAQNVKTISAGSLIAVRNRNMLRAPTIPNESAILELIGMVTSVTTSPVSTNPTLKLRV